MVRGSELKQEPVAATENVNSGLDRCKKMQIVGWVSVGREQNRKPH